MSYTLFPIKASEEDLYRLYKQHVAVFWTPDEIDFSKDAADWSRMSADERRYISYVLAFFAGSDGIVQENLALRFQRESDSQVVKLFYSFQNAMEGIHSETYSLLIDTYIKDESEKLRLFDGIKTIPSIEKKASWALKWIDSQDSFAKRLIAFACVEGIFFSGAFCSIFWLKKRGLLPGLTFSNELISRDEGLHTTFAVALYRKQVPIDSTVMYTIVREAVALEKEFICEALPCSLIGMNATLMSQYIEFVADRLVLQLGGSKLYSSQNPFDFMDLISLDGKTNFFEKKVSDYSREIRTVADELRLDADF